jgi:sulfite reductase (NADPH) hemoprotein beta-component
MMKPEPTKLFGTYPQKQEGLYMQRIPVFGGQITPTQLAGIARIATEFTHSTPLHLTTRQDIELHNVPDEKTQTVLDKLGELGFTTYGAGGDNIRNITICPCCRYDKSAFDMTLLAQSVREYLKQSPLRADMPRKFKITFAGCGNPRSKPYVNDLAFIATSPTTVKVIGAGSLGPKPRTGIVLYEQISTANVIPMTMAAIELFNEHGDRENRRKARLRHVREKMGDTKFLEVLDGCFQKHKHVNPWPQSMLFHQRIGWKRAAMLQTIAGQFSPDHALILSDAAQKADAEICVNLNHGIEIYAKDGLALPDELTSFANLPQIVACPASTTCTNGIVNCPAMAAKLSEALKGNDKFNGKTIALSGCPNNCAHSSIADIGLVGRIKTIDGTKQEVYQVLTDGGNGITDTLAQPGPIIPAGELLDYLKKWPGWIASPTDLSS